MNNLALLVDHSQTGMIGAPSVINLMRRSVFRNLSNKREYLVRNLIIRIFNLRNHTHVITVGDFNKLIVKMSGFLQDNTILSGISRS